DVIRANALTVYGDSTIRFGSATGINFTPTGSQPSMTLGSATLSASGTSLQTSGALSVAGTLTNTSGNFTGGTSGLTLKASGSNQNITLSPSGTGSTVINSNTIINGKLGVGITNPGSKLDVRVTDAEGIDPLRIAGGQSNIWFALNGDQHVFYSTEQVPDASH